MFEAIHITHRFGRFTALDDLSLSVSAGDVVGVVGLNGAGKSTLLRVLAGVLPPTGGEVRLDGENMLAAPVDLRRIIGYLAEGSPLEAGVRVGEYLKYRGALKGLHGRGLRRRVRYVMREFGLAMLYRRMTSSLSRGERQRVGLADVLLTEPDVVLLDEPLAGLDAAQARGFCQLIKGMSGGSRAVILSSHLLTEVADVCNRVCVLHEGSLVQEGVTGDLLREGLEGGVIEIELRAMDADVVRETLVGIKGMQMLRVERYHGGHVAVLCRVSSSSVLADVESELTEKGAKGLHCRWRPGSFADMLLLMTHTASGREVSL